MTLVCLPSFCAVQAVAQILFKYGSVMPERWLPGFIAGNRLGTSSIWFLTLLYRSMNANVALGLGTGGYACDWVRPMAGHLKGSGARKRRISASRRRSRATVRSDHTAEVS